MAGGIAEHIDKKGSLPLGFRIFASSKFFSSLAGSVFSILLPWLVITVTGSPLITGVADGLISIALLLSFISGTFVDRSRAKKGLFALSMFGLAAAYLVMGAALGEPLYNEKIGLIFIAAFMIGVFDDVQDTVSAFFDRILLKDHQVNPGMSLRRSILAISSLLGYVASAFFISSGFYFTVLTIAILTVIPAFMIMPVRYEDAPSDREEKFISSLRGGINEFLGNPVLKQLFMLASVTNFFWGMLTVSFVVLVEQYLTLSIFHFSALMVSLEIGVLLGNVISSRLRSLKGSFFMGTMFAWGFIFLGASYMAYIDLFLPLAVLVMGAGMVSGMTVVFVEGTIIKNTPREMMARIFGSMKTLFSGFSFLSGTVAGVLLTFIRAPFIFVVIAFPFLVMGLIGQLRFHKLKGISL